MIKIQESRIYKLRSMKEKPFDAIFDFLFVIPLIYQLKVFIY